MTVAAAALTIIAAALSGCNGRTAYADYRDIARSRWEEDSTLVWDVSVTDTLAAYDVILSVRHTPAYPYQNIWFFVENDLTGEADTLEFYLADQRGRWLGNGFGDHKEMPCLLARGVRFPHTAPYRFAVRHGMREQSLRGITEVGLFIEKEK